MEGKTDPLVSICVTFWNSSRFVSRLLDSCLSQTYKNVEVILVDDASTDGADEIVAAYAARDKRVKYFKSTENVGIMKSLERTFDMASGRFSVWLGVDDWLSQDAIEHAVQSFLKHPEASAVMPRVISLRETDESKFTLIEDVRIPTGTYSPQWIAKRAYRGFPAILCLFGMFRIEDARGAVQYFLKNCCYDPIFPEELRQLALKKAYAPDFVFFLEILSRYKNFVVDEEYVVLKVNHTTNLSFKESRRKASEVLESEYYRLLFFRPVYKQLYPSFYSGMNVHTRAQSVSEVWTRFLKAGLRPSFFDIQESRKLVADLFRDLSALEKIRAVALGILKAILRSFAFAFKGLADARRGLKDKKLPLYTDRYFLDPEARFKP